jgi:hypothetical protein
VSFHVVLIILIVLLALLAIGGAIAGARRRLSRNAPFADEVERADNALAYAFAADRGWARENLEGAARAAWTARGGGDPDAPLELVSVIDQPGTDEDRATFRGPDGTEIHLRRRGDHWLHHAG